MKLVHIFIAQIVFFLVLGTAWCVNIYKLAKCDFAASWKGEVIHAVGVVVPPASLVTVWFNHK